MQTCAMRRRSTAYRGEVRHAAGVGQQPRILAARHSHAQRRRASSAKLEDKLRHLLRVLGLYLEIMRQGKLVAQQTQPGEEARCGGSHR